MAFNSRFNRFKNRLKTLNAIWLRKSFSCGLFFIVSADADVDADAVANAIAQTV